MEDSLFALTEELPVHMPIQDNYDGISFIRTDIARSDEGRHYRMLEIASSLEGISPALKTRFITLQVEKILDAKIDEVQWRILN